MSRATEVIWDLLQVAAVLFVLGYFLASIGAIGCAASGNKAIGDDTQQEAPVEQAPDVSGDDNWIANVNFQTLAGQGGISLTSILFYAFVWRTLASHRRKKALRKEVACVLQDNDTLRKEIAFLVSEAVDHKSQRHATD
jgi:hypothetical protein